MKLGMCITKILMKEEEKFSNSVLPWAALHVHSAMVLLTAAADLFAIVLRMHCVVQNQIASSMFDLPCGFLCVLVKWRDLWRSAVTEGKVPPAVQHTNSGVKYVFAFMNKRQTGERRFVNSVWILWVFFFFSFLKAHLKSVITLENFY